MTRHFTATGFVVHDGAVLMHWHRKLNAWMPPGGHIDENEDPAQAVVREIEEESGVRAEVVWTAPRFAIDYPEQVAAPYTILVEDIDDPVEGPHKHIDMIYFCRPTRPPGPRKKGWLWVSRAELAEGRPLEVDGVPATPAPEDVRVLALEAFRVVGGLSSGVRRSR